MQNVFGHTVSKKTVFLIRNDVILYLNSQGVSDEGLQRLINTEFLNGTQFLSNLETKTGLSESEITIVYESAKKDSLFISSAVLKREIDPNWFTTEQIKTLNTLENQSFSYSWQLFNALEKLSLDWKYKPETQLNKMYNTRPS